MVVGENNTTCNTDQCFKVDQTMTENSGDDVAKALSGITEANPTELADYVKLLVSSRNTCGDDLVRDIGNTLTQDGMVTESGVKLEEAVGLAVGFILGTSSDHTHTKSSSGIENGDKRMRQCSDERTDKKQRSTISDEMTILPHSVVIPPPPPPRTSLDSKSKNHLSIQHHPQQIHHSRGPPPPPPQHQQHQSAPYRQQLHRNSTFWQRPHGPLSVQQHDQHQPQLPYPQQSSSPESSLRGAPPPPPPPPPPLPIQDQHHQTGSSGITRKPPPPPPPPQQYHQQYRQHHATNNMHGLMPPLQTRNPPALKHHYNQHHNNSFNGENIGNTATEKDRRTLFLTNIPPQVTYNVLLNYFTRNMKVQVRKMQLHGSGNNNKQQQCQPQIGYIELATHDQAMFILHNPDPVLGNRFIGIQLHHHNLQPIPHVQPLSQQQELSPNNNNSHITAPLNETVPPTTNASEESSIPANPHFEKQLDLLKKQEVLLQKQLDAHKKLLAMLKTSTNKDTDSTANKLKEILALSKKLNSVKKKKLDLLSEKQGEQVRRQTHSNNVGCGHVRKRSYSLDKRTTVLNVKGLPTNTNEGEVKRHFTPYGTILNVHVHEIDSSALVTFSSRTFAEKAKENGTIFNNNMLSIQWHHNKNEDDGPSELMDRDSTDIDTSCVVFEEKVVDAENENNNNNHEELEEEEDDVNDDDDDDDDEEERWR